MPPGATHGTFNLVDANGFLVHTEPMPSQQEKNQQHKGSTLLENGYAYRPGLFALVKLGEAALAAGTEKKLDTAALKTALAAAQEAYAAEETTETAYCDAIRSLRGAIRDLDGVPQAKHALLNRFPTDPLF